MTRGNGSYVKKTAGLLAELARVAGKPLLAVLAIFAGVMGSIFLVTRDTTILVLLLVAATLLYAQIDSDRKLRNEIVRHSFETYRQLESLVGLYILMRSPTHPLPPMRRWSISPDLGRFLVESIRLKSPRLIVELGSGASTTISCMAARASASRVLSIEHDSNYVSRTSDELRRLGLHEIGTVVLAPLTDVEVQGKTWQWYDLADVPSLADIDLLVIDGPPTDLQKMARYPALPLLFGRLAPGALVLVDDGNDVDVRHCVEEWSREFPELSVTYLEFEKGAFLLRKGGPSVR